MDLFFSLLQRENALVKLWKVFLRQGLSDIEEGIEAIAS
jgi:hypothetical protein